LKPDAVARDEEGVLVIRSGHSHMMFDAGDRLPSQSGDYIYFQHNGKPYLIQDPQIIAKAQALLAPMKLLGDKQRLLGDQQSMLGIQQRKIIEEVRRELKPIIEQAIREGKGTPLKD
jgi:hypothetical protein